jgi:signal transduction histidine kinase
MKTTSVRFRLLIWNIGLLTLVLFGFLLVTHTFVRGYLLSSIDARLKSVAERTADMAIRFKSSGGQMPLPSGSPRPPRFGGSHRERMVHLYNPQGKAVTLFGRQAPSQEEPWDKAAFKQAILGEAVFKTIKTGHSTLRLYSCPVIYNGKCTWVVQSAASFTELEMLINNLTFTLTILVPVAIIIAGFGGFFLTERALRPVRQITDAANALSTDDLSQRLPVMGADEFAHLAETINNLLTRLEYGFDQLKCAIERERRFTADASHELRTPLTAIKANASLALKGQRAPQAYKDILQSIDQSADLMSNLVQGLLLLARSDSGQLSPDYTKVNLRKLLNDVAAIVPRKSTQAAFQVQVDDSLKTIIADPEQLRRVIINLLENSLRYAPRGSKITLEAYGEGNKAVITVTDEGAGIAPEHLPHLGERFFRVDAARTRGKGGAGLGLSICKSIVEAHNGQMTIDSAPGHGTSVTIIIPRAPSLEV